MTIDVTGTFLRWTALRAVLHRGYWLVASLYLVIDAHLSAFQLVALGVAQGIVSLLFEVPAGAVADAVSRKWALVIAHLLVGAAMVATGLVTAFPALVVTQMIWGIGWTFASGSDVAWVTDELDRPARIAGVLAARARWEQLGAIAGLVGFGLLALAIGRGPAMVLAGIAMTMLGLMVAIRFSERGFTPSRSRRWSRSTAIFRRGVGLARRDREIVLILTATLLVDGAAEAYGRLFPKQLVELGLPRAADPILWFTALGILALAVGASVMWIVERRIERGGAARRMYVLACFTGVVGLLMLAGASSALFGSLGVLLVGGIALSVTRAVGVIWINRRTSSEVRATVQSLLAQAEYAGEIVCGLALGILAQASSIAVAFVCSAALIALAGMLVLRSPAGRGSGDLLKPTGEPHDATHSVG